MKTTLLLLLLPTLLLAQEFTFRQEFDTIPVEINGWQPFAPWTGGDSETAPEFCDIDADGDYDCFMGNRAYRITNYENLGNSTTLDFKYKTRYFCEISLDSIYGGRVDPCFVDIDADGDYDLFSSDNNGLVHQWTNIGTVFDPDFVITTDSLNNIDVPGPASLTLTDIDSDYDFDLFVGDNGGKIHYYQNIGTPELFDFSFVTSQFQNIDVGMKANPCFVDIDADGDQDLFVGNDAGKIWFYRNDSDSTGFQFTLISDYYNEIDVVDYAAPDFVDLDGDEDFDLAIGRKVLFSNSPVYGDVVFYENTGSPQEAQWALISEEYLTWDIGTFIRNHGADIDADNDEDLFIMLKYINPEQLSFYENIGTPEFPSFAHITNNYQNIILNSGIPYFGDFDNDQDFDLLMGEGLIPNPPYPGLRLYRNDGTPQEADFSLVSEDLIPWEYHAAIRPAMVDIDADGDQDIFIVDNSQVLYFWENHGTSSRPEFTTPVLNWQGITALSPICFADIDQDGDFDLFLLFSDWYNIFRFYENVGTPQVPDMQLVTDHFLGTDIELIYPSGIYFSDIDDDGDGDFMISSEVGGMMFFRNTTGDTSAVQPRLSLDPHHGIQFSIGPNPANPITWISYNLPYPQKAEIAVYNLLGQKVATLASGLQMPGQRTLIWDAANYASGQYFVRMETEVSDSGNPTYAVERVVVVK